eukprot:m.190211 g.190211  ORF g.190211 m.190211 type:complete len:475 (-) comp17991_c0_seq1:114-1538(-)
MISGVEGWSGAWLGKHPWRVAQGGYPLDAMHGGMGNDGVGGGGGGRAKRGIDDVESDGGLLESCASLLAQCSEAIDAEAARLAQPTKRPCQRCPTSDDDGGSTWGRKRSAFDMDGPSSSSSTSLWHGGGGGAKRVAWGEPRGDVVDAEAVGHADASSTHDPTVAPVADAGSPTVVEMDEDEPALVAGSDVNGSLPGPAWGRAAHRLQDMMTDDTADVPMDSNPLALAHPKRLELSNSLVRMLRKLGLQWYAQADGSLLANGGLEVTDVALSKLQAKVDADGVIRIHSTNDSGDAMLVEGRLSDTKPRMFGRSSCRVDIRIKLLPQWPRRIHRLDAPPVMLGLPAPRSSSSTRACYVTELPAGMPTAGSADDTIGPTQPKRKARFLDDDMSAPCVPTGPSSASKRTRYGDMDTSSIAQGSHFRPVDTSVHVGTFPHTRHRPGGPDDVVTREGDGSAYDGRGGKRIRTNPFESMGM